MGYLDKTKILIKSKYRLKKYIIANYIVLYNCESMFLKDNQYFYVCLFWGKAKWDIYVPYACKSIFFILNVYCYK